MPLAFDHETPSLMATLQTIASALVVVVAAGIVLFLVAFVGAKRHPAHQHEDIGRARQVFRMAREGLPGPYIAGPWRAPGGSDAGRRSSGRSGRG